jgi:NADPH:quinone reductase
VIDYQSEDLREAIRSRYPRGVDKAVNGVEGETANQVVQALRDGGQMVDLTGSATAERPDVRVIKDYVVRADGNRLASIARMIDGGHLRLEVQQVFPFERAPAALELVQGKHVRGKVVLEVA